MELLNVSLAGITHASTRISLLVGVLGQRGYGDHMDWGDGAFWVMLTMMAVFWLGLLAVIAWGVAVYARGGRSREEAAIEIARRRYARGEINADEFDRIRRDLG